jgi:hypothetical protein
MTGVVVCLWPVVVGWIETKVHGGVIYVDEKWIKIRKVWHYWFVALDQTTQLPLVGYLSDRRSGWACQWMGIQLEQMGIWIRAVCTDGFSGYSQLLPGVVHLLCHFHHQQGVHTWLKEHIPQEEDIASRQQAMHKVFQTKDKRTVRRRLEKLSMQALAWGIMGWVDQTKAFLGTLLPAVGSRCLPRTTNAIERFFRTFMRFYKVRCGFHSVESARLELLLFLLVYVFTQRQKDGKAPIEAILPQAAQMPFYRLLNDPFGRLDPSDDVKENAPMAQESIHTLLAA